MRLFSNVTANTTGTEPWIRIGNGGSFLVAIPASANLGGGTLSIQLADVDTETILSTPAELSFSSLPEAKIILLPAGIKIRAQLEDAVGASIPFFDLIPADNSDKNLGPGRI